MQSCVLGAEGGAGSSLVPMGSVGELLGAYDGERLSLPPPIEVWRWGWTPEAEVWNGRLAMFGLVALLSLEAAVGQPILRLVGLVGASLGDVTP